MCGLCNSQRVFDFHFNLQAYIETDIQKYSPAPGDLAYPEKLVIGVSIINNNIIIPQACVGYEMIDSQQST